MKETPSSRARVMAIVSFDTVCMMAEVIGIVKNSLQETSINKVKVFDSVSLSNATHEIGDNTFQANYTVIYSKKVLP